MRPGRVMPFALVASMTAAACVPPGAPRPTPPHLERPHEWQFQLAEHVALWYHGLAHTGSPLEDERATPLAPVDSVYVRHVTETKRLRGVAPTELELQSAEFAATFRQSAAYRQLEFLPLYFHDLDALTGAVRIWAQVGGDPRRAGSAQAANAVALLSGMFPQPVQRAVVARWTDALIEERRVFFAQYWTEQSPDLERSVRAAHAAWQAFSPSLRPLLAYLGLEGGDVFAVPALGADGRILPRGAGRPRAAVRVEPTGNAADDEPSAPHGDDVAFGFLHELMYPLAAEAVREYIAPARLRELGADRLDQHAAVRGGDMVLEAVAADRADAYRRHFLRATAQLVPDPRPQVARAFRQTFPLPPELERGLEETVRRALAGI
jgi:hypothetical protein